jgi:hypothetical protein
MITEADIDANQPVVVKWDKPLQSSGVATDGVMAGQASEFITRIEKESELLGMLRYVEMEGETQDLQTLRVRSNLMSMEKLSGVTGAQVDPITSLTETTPTILKKTLVAHAFTAFTKISKVFLKTNIEKEGFIAKYEALLAPACAFSAEQVAVFGKATGADAAGIHNLKGILAQLDDVATASVDTTSHDLKDGYALGKYGYYDDTTGGSHTPAWKALNAGDGYEVLPQIDKMMNAYVKQGGKRKFAKIFVSSELSAICIAEASKRETDGGDKLFFNDNGNMVFRGIEIIPLDVLDTPVNSYGDVIIIANPDSIAYGPVMEAESEAEYKIESKAYLTSVDWMFDVGLIFAEDVLYGDVDYTAKPSG